MIVTRDFFKGSFVFFDWCPAMSGATNIIFSRWSEDHIANCCESICSDIRSKTWQPLTSIEAAYREDGLFIFIIHVEYFVEGNEIFDLARRVSLRLKSEAFNHRHVHHPSEADIIANHYPILCAPAVKQKVYTNEASSFYTINTEECLSQEGIGDILRSNKKICNLRAANRRFNETSQSACVQLKVFLGRKYDFTMESIESIEATFQKKKKEGYFELLSIFIIAITFSNISIIYLNENIDSFKCLDPKDWVKSFISSVIITVGYSYLRSIDQKTQSILREIDEAIGFLNRASTYCGRMSELMRQLDRDDDDSSMFSFTPIETYQGFIGSLSSIRSHYKTTTDRKFAISGLFVALLGLLFATI